MMFLVLHRQQFNHVYSIYCMFAMYLSTMKSKASCIGSLGRALCLVSPPALPRPCPGFINLFSSAVFCRTSSSLRSFLCCSLSLSCDGFEALLEIFGMSMLTTSTSRTPVKASRLARVVRSHAYCPHVARVCVHWTYDIRYIYQRNSAVQLTGVGLAHASTNTVKTTNSSRPSKAPKA